MKYLYSILAVALLCFAGCSTPPKPEQLASYLADARDISSAGTQVALLDNPKNRTELEMARDSLSALESLPPDKVTVDDLTRALTKLPLDQLRSEKGQIYVLAGKVLVRRFSSWISSPEMDVGASGMVQKFAAAMRQGMDDVLLK